MPELSDTNVRQKIIVNSWYSNLNMSQREIVVQYFLPSGTHGHVRKHFYPGMSSSLIKFRNNYE